VSLKPSVIVTSATPAAIAAKNATSNIPIVALVVGDPVGTGLVTNIARPEGNVTGLSLVNPELGVKRLDLLKQALPHVSRVGVLSNPLNPQHAGGLQELEAAAKVIRVSIQRGAATATVRPAYIDRRRGCPPVPSLSSTHLTNLASR